MALRAYSSAMLWPLDLRRPVYPVKGYSITVPITTPDAAPISTVMDAMPASRRRTLASVLESFAEAAGEPPDGEEPFILGVSS